ncbi:Cys/Met metabolism PLP-dependent enzyme [Cooperia oncophora]
MRQSYRRECEVILRELEQGAATLLYNSGLAACSAVLLEFLNAGDHLICMKPMYSGSYSFITETLTRFNVSVDFVDVEKEANFTLAVEKAMKKNTKVEAALEEVRAIYDRCMDQKQFLAGCMSGYIGGDRQTIRVSCEHPHPPF